MSEKTVSVIGLGYIGLPAAIMAAVSGYRVIGVDINQDIVDKTNAGILHFVEPPLNDWLQDVVAKGQLKATTSPQAADVFVIAVPTPIREGNKPDLAYVLSAARNIAPVLKSGDLVIIESTVFVGATEEARHQLTALRPDLFEGGMKINMAFCPERVLPGNIAHELETNDRIIGGFTPECSQAACEFYRGFVTGALHKTSTRTAELVKLSENAYRDVNIAFANEISMISERQGINGYEVVQLANLHPRVNILNPGPGVGGHCIAVDPWFIVHSEPNLAQIIRTAREVNLAKTDYVIAQINAMAEELGAKSVALFGLAYKANSDDMRESPSVAITQALQAKSIFEHIIVVEPHIDDVPSSIDGTKLMDAREALSAADLAVILVGHSTFVEMKSEFSDANCLDTVGFLQ